LDIGDFQISIWDKTTADEKILEFLQSKGTTLLNFYRAKPVAMGSLTAVLLLAGYVIGRISA